MPGDKWPEYNPPISRVGLLFILAVVGIIALGSLGWIFE